MDAVIREKSIIANVAGERPLATVQPDLHGDVLVHALAPSNTMLRLDWIQRVDATWIAGVNDSIGLSEGQIVANSRLVRRSGSLLVNEDYESPARSD